MNKTKRIGVLTGGGDCPGLNAAIRSVVRTSQELGVTVLGIEEGFLGLAEGKIRDISGHEVSGILPRGGTFLRSSRFNPFKEKRLVKKCLANLRSQRLDGLIVIGGDGSLGLALDFHLKCAVPVIGIPKTIDNDVYGTEYAIGFFTAVETAMEAIDKLHTTAESHNYIMVVEVMGRHCGYLAAFAGLAGGADFILVPENRVRIDELTKSLKDRHKGGKNFSIVVVAEDATLVDRAGKVVLRTPSVKDEYGHIKISGAGIKVQEVLKRRLGFEVRTTVLGHVQRGGSPVAVDRILATAMGYLAAQLAAQGRWGQLLAYDQGQVVAKDLGVVREGKKQMPMAFYEMAKTFFG